MAEHKFRRSGVAVLGVIALGVSAMLGSSAATAAPDYDFGNIESVPAGGSSLTVHKYQDQAPGGATGNPDGTVTGTFQKPIEDVVFTAYPLLNQADSKPVDLLTYEGWAGTTSPVRMSLEDAAGAVATNADCVAPAGYALGTGVLLSATDQDGMGTAALAVGAYVVCETYAPSTVTKRSNPFLVTIPFPAKEGTPGADAGWLYNVHVYPKNTVGEFEKTIEPQTELGLGAAVDFTITGSIPDISPNTWTEFTVTDTLDPRLDAATIPATVVAPAGATGVGIEYDSAGRTVIVRFTDSAWLKANAGTNFEITVHTTVNATGVDGVIKNTAQQWVNNPTFDDTGNPPSTTPEVTTNWGTATLKKVDSAETPAGENVGLQGAEFEVFAAATPYAATPGECATATTGNAIEFTSGTPQVTTTKVVSDSNGIVNVPALFVSDSKNDPVEAKFRCYVLVETQAPAGYVTPTGDAAKRAIAINTGANDLTGEAIENSRQLIPGLPLTGAQGQVLLITGGIAAAAIVVGLVLVNRRRQNAAL